MAAPYISIIADYLWALRSLQKLMSLVNVHGTTIMKNQSVTQKLNNAWNGISYTFKTENNFRFHCYSAATVIIFFFFLQPALIWWALILICIGLVIAAELANTAIENLVDHLHPEMHSAIGKVKDIMAGFVLSVSILAALVGLLAIIDTLA